MAYTRYIFGDNDIWNILPDDDQTLSTIKLDPSSDVTQIIAIPTDGERVVGLGSFVYSSSKNTIGDILSGKLDQVLIYEKDQLVSREIYSPSADFRTVVFGTYQEQLKLYSGDDAFFGSPDFALDDAVRGFSGNDRFTGYGSGQFGDFFDGDSGFDIAYLRGFYSNYTIKQEAIWDPLKRDGSTITVFSVTDSNKTRDGVDFYSNVERLKFADKVIALDIDGNAGQAYRLYKAALDRVPDEQGLADWVNYLDNGGLLNAVSQMFINSAEFRSKYGALDDYNFVNQLYRNVLDRDGETKGVNDWVGALSGGAKTRAEVLVGFSESQENQDNVIGAIKKRHSLY